MMHARTLISRNLLHHWPAHLAVALAVAVATAVLTGSLVVGDAMRGSLRASALSHLGNVTQSVEHVGFVRAELADALPVPAAPAILSLASATHAENRATVHRVQVLGVDARFWSRAFDVSDPLQDAPPLSVVLNEALAAELAARPGDDVLLRLPTPRAISPETLLGRRDDATTLLRLTVAGVIPAGSAGAFTLQPRQTAPRNAFVPLADLQRALDRRDRVNTLLITGVAPLRDSLRSAIRLTDLGIRLRVDGLRRYVAVESEALLLPPAVEPAARTVASSLSCQSSGVFAYLANSIQVVGADSAGIPYSTIVGVEASLLTDLRSTEDVPPALASGEILLNAWAAEDLAADVGDTLRLTYYEATPHGELRHAIAEFKLAGAVQLSGAAADRGLVPEFPGVTDAESLTDWQPPFPIDLDRIRDKDEEYWDERGPTPKAFVTLADAQRLWADEPERFGRLTSLRVHVPPGESVATIADALAARLLSQLDLEQAGFRIDDVRRRAVQAARGTTDFAALFIGFSQFLLVSGALLIILLFRLGVERRATEIGLLLATGFTTRRVAGFLLTEGAIIVVLGASLGVLLAQGYAWLMLGGLRSWWSAAANTPLLQLHTQAMSLAVGGITSVIVALLAIAWALRGLTRAPPRALLAGVADPAENNRAARADWRTPAATATLVASLIIVASSLLTDALALTAGFFLGAVGLLTSALLGLAAWLRCEPERTFRLRGTPALVQLGWRNARRHVGRSLLTAGLIAVATFMITALQAMRLTPAADVTAHDSPTGGFTLLAEASVPILRDLNTAVGRDTLAISPDIPEFRVYPCRLRSGDETSCLNLYRPVQPRILGVPESVIERGGFRFANSLATTPAERDNPWRLLQSETADDAIPTIADEAAARWQLHKQLGDIITVSDERSRDVSLRLVALLRGSVLQGELLIAEQHFTRVFPSTSGYGFFLIETPPDLSEEVERCLERDLTTHGLAITPIRERLRDLSAVQNTYLSTFQTLGGFGLLLGTLGLTAVMLRNVWQRRRELALLRTLGYSRGALALLILSENTSLVLIGMATGVGSAAVVTIPHIIQRGTPIPWLELLLMFAGILAAGLLAGSLALAAALRTSPLPDLRSE